MLNGGMSECPYCQTTEHQIKAGRTGAGSIQIILLTSKALYIHDIHHFPILNQVHRIKCGFRLVAAAALWQRATIKDAVWALLSCQPERCRWQAVERPAILPLMIRLPMGSGYKDEKYG